MIVDPLETRSDATVGTRELAFGTGVEQAGESCRREGHDKD